MRVFFVDVTRAEVDIVDGVGSGPFIVPEPWNVSGSNANCGED